MGETGGRQAADIVDGRSGLDRRAFLARTGAAAAATGALWVAPEILAPSTAFAGASCVVQASTFGALPAPQEWKNSSWAASGSYPALQLTSSTAAIGAPAPNTGNGTITAPLLTGYGIPNVPVFYFDLDDADNGEGYSVTFNFRNAANTADVPVYNVRFRVWDIDRNTTGGQNYIDRVQVTANAGVTVAGTAPGGGVLGTGTAANPFLGNITDNRSTATSYGDYVLTGAVTTFTLTYTNNAAGDGTRMVIGIGDITFCR